MRLAGRVALITGAGTGIGRAIAERFASEGARVAVHYRESREAAAEVVTAITSRGGSALAVQADIAVEADVRAMIRRIDDDCGRLDILVNNAGWSTRVPHAQLEDLTDEIWDRTFDTNLRGAFYAVRAAAPLLRRQPGSSIVNIASAAGFTGFGSSIAYVSSKAAMIAMTKALGRALAPGVRVNAVAPGLARTRFANWPEAAFEHGDSVTPIGRLVTVEEIAAAALFLSADATGITGETILVDGGLTQLGRFKQEQPR